MGQKVHPYGFRLGVNKPWRSRWFVVRDYDKLLIEDVQLKRELKEKLKLAGVSSVGSGAAGQEAAADHPHRASRHRDRAQGRGDRQAEGERSRSAPSAMSPSTSLR